MLRTFTELFSALFRVLGMHKNVKNSIPGLKEPLTQVLAWVGRIIHRNQMFRKRNCLVGAAADETMCVIMGWVGKKGIENDGSTEMILIVHRVLCMLDQSQGDIQIEISIARSQSCLHFFIQQIFLECQLYSRGSPRLQQ